MSDTKIAWCDKVWNPVVGCTKIAAGCKNCYAHRLHNMRHLAYLQGKNLPGQYILPFDSIQMFPERLEQPLHWHKPRRIFVCSMGDLFHEKVPYRFILRVINEGILRAPQHTYMLLTKRPERMAASSFRSIWSSNIWHGVSISTQDDGDRMIPELLQIPGKKFVSYEPALGPVDFSRVDFSAWETTTFVNVLTGEIVEDSDSEVVGTKEEDAKVNWLIIGCESGPNRRPCKLEWVRSAVEQCQEAGVPCFVKQIEIDGKVEHDMEKFPKDLRVQQKGAE